MIDDHFKWLDCIYGDVCCPDSATETFIIVMVCLHVIINPPRCPAFKSSRVLCGRKPLFGISRGQNVSPTVWQINICHLPGSTSYPSHSPMIAGRFQFIPASLISCTNLYK